MTLTDRLERFFLEHPNTWIDGKDLAGIAGTYAWRSRICNVRERGLAIENRQRRIKLAKDRHYVISEYRAVIQ